MFAIVQLKIVEKMSFEPELPDLYPEFFKTIYF